MSVHFVLDEMAVAGHMDAIDNAVGIGRGYSVRLQFYFQSLGQLHKCFPQGQEQTLLSNTSQIFFGVNDNDTAEYVSKRLGDQTIMLHEEGGSSGTSSGHNDSMRDMSRNRGRNDSSSYNFRHHQRRLLKPEEVMALSPRQAITFTPGVPPICTTLIRYYETQPRTGFKAFSNCVRWVVLCMFFTWLAVMVTPAFMRVLFSR